MGFFAGIPLWLLLLILSVGQAKAYMAELVLSSENEYVFHKHYGFLDLKSLAENSKFIAANSRNLLSLGINFDKVCSYWNNFHYKTFNDMVFYYPGTCTYVFASHCKNNYEDFVIHIRHTTDSNNFVLYTNVTLKIEEIIVQLMNDTVLVQGEVVQLPHSVSTTTIHEIGPFTQVSSSIGLMFKKYNDGSFELQLDGKYANQTCGLCGNLMDRVFDKYDIPFTETEYGNLQKADGPNENCPDPSPPNWSDCSVENETICEVVLKNTSFEICHDIIDVEPYIEACRQDLCRCEIADQASYICATVAQYSHQCILHKGQPQNWRTPDLCYRSCPPDMIFMECGSPCMNSCSDPERQLICDGHCVEGCFCSNGLIYDDVGSKECIRADECPCRYNGNIYQPGEFYSTSCRTCLCDSGRWNCTVIPCSETCSIEGGTHVTTFDQLRYTMHGECYYVISKDCMNFHFTILGELNHCGIRDADTCLKGVTIFLNKALTKLEVKSYGEIYMNGVRTRLPVYSVSEKVIIFQPSPFYIIVHSTSFGLQVVVQTLPIMQLFVVLNPEFKTQTCGLCGNFNNVQNDDFRTMSGIIQGTAAAFVNTWRVNADCPKIKDIYDDPCTLSVESAEYAKHWCGKLLDSTGLFSPCHNLVDPDIYYKNCMMDTCRCENSENCMCAALFSYYKICAAKGILLDKWQTIACSNYSTYCPKMQSYSYKISSCLPTCRSLSEPDILCKVHFDPLIGCTCRYGYYLNESGSCMPASSCPCYYRGNEVPPDQSINDNGIICVCNKGKINCLKPFITACDYPKTYANCSNLNKDTGIECAKSCQTLDMNCYSTRCIQGCVCPPGLVSDDKGGCITEDKCPCIHNGIMYGPGAKIQVRCNTCTCEKRIWNCTHKICLATCTVFGNGHYMTFDGKRYNFNGECQYTLAQDHCSVNNNSSTFTIITENIPCGTTGITCSKSIKIFLGGYELILIDDHLKVAQKGFGTDVPYRLRLMGIYLVIESESGLLMLWDKKTTIFIKVTGKFKGTLCGLCGNYDGNANNDFTTRSNAIVGNVVEFGNSWKFTPTCPDAKIHRDPCSLNPYRVPWAQKQCSIINSEVFSACHPQVDPFKYYDACVTDSCACNTGGDCECFCTAVAAYAQACGEYGLCISWRGPSICPLFCDYYNEENGCVWHYKPCGGACMKTCRNPSGICNYDIRGLEGCYPTCPPENPYFDEDEMKCVSTCGCYDEDRKHYKLGAIVPRWKNCYVCNCTMDGIFCVYDVNECTCTYEGHVYKYNEVVYRTVSDTEGCVTGICKENGTIYRDVHTCPTTTEATYSIVSTTTKFTLTTIPSTAETIPTSTPTTSTMTATTQATSPTTICQDVCEWTEYFNLHNVTLGTYGGDIENLDKIRNSDIEICENPKRIECRPTDNNANTQKFVCSLDEGLICENRHQINNFLTCYDYEIRYYCCKNYCGTTYIKTTIPTTTTTTSPTITTTTTTTLSTTIPTTTISTTTTPSTPTTTASSTATTSIPRTPTATTPTTTALSTTTPATTTPTTTASSITASTPTTTAPSTTTTTRTPTATAPSTATATTSTTTTQTATTPSTAIATTPRTPTTSAPSTTSATTPTITAPSTTVSSTTTTTTPATTAPSTTTTTTSTTTVPSTTASSTTITTTPSTTTLTTTTPSSARTTTPRTPTTTAPSTTSATTPTKTAPSTTASLITASTTITATTPTITAPSTTTTTRTPTATAPSTATVTTLTTKTQTATTPSTGTTTTPRTPTTSAPSTTSATTPTITAPSTTASSTTTTTTPATTAPSTTTTITSTTTVPSTTASSTTITTAPSTTTLTTTTPSSARTTTPRTPTTTAPSTTSAKTPTKTAPSTTASSITASTTITATTPTTTAPSTTTTTRTPTATAPSTATVTTLTTKTQTATTPSTGTTTTPRTPTTSAPSTTSATTPTITAPSTTASSTTTTTTPATTAPSTTTTITSTTTVPSTTASSTTITTAPSTTTLTTTTPSSARTTTPRTPTTTAPSTTSAKTPTITAPSTTASSITASMTITATTPTTTAPSTTTTTRTPTATAPSTATATTSTTKTQTATTPSTGTTTTSRTPTTSAPSTTSATTPTITAPSTTASSTTTTTTPATTAPSTTTTTTSTTTVPSTTASSTTITTAPSTTTLTTTTPSSARTTTPRTPTTTAPSTTSAKTPTITAPSTTASSTTTITTTAPSTATTTRTPTAKTLSTTTAKTPTTTAPSTSASSITRTTAPSTTATTPSSPTTTTPSTPTVTAPTTTKATTATPTASLTTNETTPTTTFPRSTGNRTIYPVTCTPRCYMTNWIDAHEPTTGESGEEIENLKIANASGIEVCSLPVQIMCQVKNMSKEQNEKQNITCTLVQGLICYNDEQASKQCYDYEIRYICCDDVQHCETTAATPTTTCQCNINGSLFQPGNIISNITDSSGCTILEICSKSCNIEKSYYCPSTSYAPATLKTIASTTISTTMKTHSTVTTPKTSTRTVTTKTTPPSTTISTTATQFTVVTSPKTSPRTTTTTTPSSTSASTKTTTQFTTVTSPKTSPRTTITTTPPSTSTSTKTTTQFTTVTTPKTSPITTTTTTTKTTPPSTTISTTSTQFTAVTFSKTSPRTTTTTIPSSTSASTKTTTQFTTVISPKTSPRTATTPPSTSASTKTTTQFTTVTTPKTSPRTATTTTTTPPSTTLSMTTTQLTTVTTFKTSPITTATTTPTSITATATTTVTAPKTTIHSTTTRTSTSSSSSTLRTSMQMTMTTARPQTIQTTEATISISKTNQATTRTAPPSSTKSLVQTTITKASTPEITYSKKATTAPQGCYGRKPGETWSPPDDKCIKYFCDDHYELITIKTPCQPFNPSSCIEGTITTDESGCCKICKEMQVGKCDVHSNLTVIHFQNCMSPAPVKVNYCEGTCMSYTKNSFMNQKMEGKCTCCVPKTTEERTITLECKNGKPFKYKFTYILTCDCSVPTCEDLNDQK